MYDDTTYYHTDDDRIHGRTDGEGTHVKRHDETDGSGWRM
jgi:hypothetical protein